MIDPAVRRRRRTVLAVLVVVSLVLITAGFGATGSGAVGGPIGALGTGAAKVLKPARDLVHWVGDTIDAKGENQALRREAERLRVQNAQLQTRLRQMPKLRGLQTLINALDLKQNDPVVASVVQHSPTAWASTVVIDKGRRDGIAAGQAVVGSGGPGAGLVGFVTGVRDGNATISLLPDQGVAVGAYLEGKDPILTVQGAGAGTSTDLELLNVPATTQIKTGARVVTSGTTDGRFPSLAPKDLPIGTVTRVDNRGADGQVVHLRPTADLRNLEAVAVLTTRVDGNRKP